MRLRHAVYYKANGSERWYIVACFRFHGDAATYVNREMSLRVSYQIRTLGA